MNEQDLFKLLGDALRPEIPNRPIADLTFGIDARGDEAFFIEEGHINGWEIDYEVQDALIGQGATFFRVIYRGEHRSGHGWIEDGRIVQWG